MDVAEKMALIQRIRMIASHYTPEHQVLKLAEECSELAAVATKWVNDGMEVDLNLIGHVYEEVADVMIMLTQFMNICNCEESIMDMVAFKVDRQEQRIKEGK